MKNGNDMRTYLRALCVIGIACLMVVPVSASELSVKHRAMSAPTGPDTIYVDGKNTAGPWDGTPEHPYQFIQDGIYHAGEDYYVYVSNATYHENPVIYYEGLELLGENMETTIIDGSHSGSVVQILADDVWISGFTIMNGGNDSDNAGVMIQATGCVVYANAILHNYNYGAYVAESGNIFVSNNFIENAYQALDVPGGNFWDDSYPCGGNYWSNYTGVDQKKGSMQNQPGPDGIGDTPYTVNDGSVDHYPLIHPYGSIINKNTSEIFLTIQGAIDDGNTKNGHHIFVENGKYDEHVWIDKTLVVQGEGKEGTIIDGSGTGTVVKIQTKNVVLTGFTIEQSGTQEAGIEIDAANDMITGNIIKDNYYGIILYSYDAVIAHNSITKNNWTGVFLIGGSQNFIIENSITDNFYAGVGTYFYANGNFVFHNNFMRNRYNAYDDGTNVWDDGYPSGGNYWDDYTGVDQRHGPLQDQLGSDGIGDTPYLIPNVINKDRYPYMDPYTGSDTIPPSLHVLSPQNGLYIRNHRHLAGLLKNKIIIFGRITITAEASDAQSGVAKVEFYIDDMMHPQAVITQPPYQWTWKQHAFIHYKHTIAVVAIDNAGNINDVVFQVFKFF